MAQDDPTLFSERLAEFSAGTVDAELTAKLADVIKAVRITGKGGSITLSISAALDEKAKDNDVVDLKYKVAAKIPTRPFDPDKFKSYGSGDLEQMESNVTPIRAAG